MKKCISLIVIVLLTSCDSSTKNPDKHNSPTYVSNNHSSRRIGGGLLKEKEDENLLPIDTAEFVDFWASFHKAIVSRDTQLLSTLTKDELLGRGIDSPSLCILSELYKTGFPLTFHEGKILKNEFLKKLNEILIPQFMELLKRYDLKKDLYRQSYSCLHRIQDKEYHFYTEFDDMANTISFKMAFSDVNQDSSVGVEFLFSKGRDKKIKLFAVSCYALSISV